MSAPLPGRCRFIGPAAMGLRAAPPMCSLADSCGARPFAARRAAVGRAKRGVRLRADRPRQQQRARCEARETRWEREKHWAGTGGEFGMADGWGGQDGGSKENGSK